MKRIYLACPYSVNIDNPKSIIGRTMLHYRVKMADKAAAMLMKEGHIVFSPVSHSHRIAKHVGNHFNHSFWLEQDFSYLEWADEMYILMLRGWDESYGIGEERKYMIELSKPTILIHPSSLNIGGIL